MPLVGTQGVEHPNTPALFDRADSHVSAASRTEFPAFTLSSHVKTLALNMLNLLPVAGEHLELNERRHHRRFEILGEIQANLIPGEVPLFVLDMSADGFAVQSPVAFTRGNGYEFEFASARWPNVTVPAINVHCLRVTTSDEPCYVAGFSFSSQISAADRKKLDRLVQEAVNARLSDNPTEE
jgi:hypothetical protein